MFTKRYATLANDYKVAKQELENFLEEIECYQGIDYFNRIRFPRYNECIEQADFMAGYIIRLEEKMEKAYIEFNS